MDFEFERYLTNNYPLAFCWAIFVLLGMIGLGRFVARLVNDEDALAAGWGLHAGWGVGVYLFLGGILAVFHLAGATGISLLVGVGAANFIWTTYRAGLPTRAKLASLPWHTWPAFAIVAVMFAGGICWQGTVNEADDFGAYYNFCQKVLMTGSFDEPFSWRRLASLGGHTMLQCSILAHATYANAQIFERSLCPVILLGMIFGFRRGMVGRSSLGLMIGIVTITTPIIRMNTTSHLTAVMLFVGLFITIDLIERAPSNRLRLYAAAGLIAAALSSLRAQNVAAAGLTLGFFWLGFWINDKKPWRAAIGEAFWWGGSMFLAMLPWMIMGYRSNGSPLFPLFQGGNNMAFDPQIIDGSLYSRMSFPIETLLSAALFPLCLAMLAGPQWRRSVAARAVTVAAVLTSMLLAYGVSMSPDSNTILRYVQPLVLSGAVVALMSAAVTPRRRIVAWAFSILLLAVNMPERCNDLWNHYQALSHTDKILMPYGSRVVADYREAQLLIPEGKRVLVCSDFSFLFDYRRNDLWNIDLPNGTSPAPHLPFKRPPDEMKRYLQGLGIEYIIFVDFDKSDLLYSRRKMRDHAMGDVPLWKLQSAYFLDFFSVMDHLALSETKLGRIGDLNVVQLKP